MNNVLKWSGCALVVIGAILTACKLPLNVYFFNAGAFLYCIWAWRVKEMSILAVNAILLIVYTVGILIA